MNVQTGQWTALDSGIGAGMDSYFEYLVKGTILFADTRWMNMFKGEIFTYWQVINFSVQNKTCIKYLMTPKIFNIIGNLSRKKII